MKLLITHNDLDGYSPIILAKLMFKDIEYIIIDNDDVNGTFKRLFETNEFEKYEQVFITDLGLPIDICEKINNSNIKDKVRIFDHHKNFAHVNNYSFGRMIVEKKGNKASGTSLFFEYLVSIGFKPNGATVEFVDYVRQYDTWEWKEKNNIDSKKLNDLFFIYKDIFVDMMLKQLENSEDFDFTSEQEAVLELEQNRIEQIYLEKKQQLYKAKLNEYNIGIVFSENYKSEIGNRLAEEFKETLDFIVIIDISSGASLSGVKDVDLGKFAQIYGGDGHKNSAGFKVLEEVRIKTINMIFNNDIKILN